MTESVVTFGPNRRYLGIFSPAAEAVTDVAVVITNSGIIHRVGANRLHVRLARKLASLGWHVFRYDLPGIGDSESCASAGDLHHDRVKATQAAFDVLEKQSGIRRFVMVGLCSGADHSLLVACTDTRVVGAVLIDPTALVVTTKHRILRSMQLARRVLRPRILKRLVSGHYRLVDNLRSGGGITPDPGAPRAIGRRSHPEIWGALEQAFRILISRHVRLLMIVTQHSAGIYSYRRQMLDGFPHLRTLAAILDVERRPGADHTFSAEKERLTLEARVLTWLKGFSASVSP